MNIRAEETSETLNLRGRIFVCLTDALPKDILKQNPLARALVELNQHIITCAAWFFFSTTAPQTAMDQPLNGHHDICEKGTDPIDIHPLACGEMNL